MFPYSTIISYGELKEWLSDFSDLVSDKVLEKMPYNMWRHLSQSRNASSDVFIDWDNSKAEIYFPGDATVHTLVKDDNSFGAFIFENFLEDDNYWVTKADKMNYVDVNGVYHSLDPRHVSVQCTSSNSYPIKNYKLDFAQSESVKNAVIDAGVAIKASGAATIGRLKDAIAAAPISICDTFSDVSFSIDTKVDKSEFEARINEINKTIEKHIIKNEESNTMNAFKFDFGPVNGNAVRMSMYGLAVKNKANTFVSYDAKSGEIMDVDVLNFDGANFLYKMPVAMKDIAIGDVVIHHGAPMFVVGKSTDGKGLVVIDVIAGERKEVMLAKSPFGFNFATKVVNFLGNAFNGSANADNPFGNMWMLMAMSGDNKDMNDMLPFMMMANGGNVDPNMLMFMAMSGKGGNDMILPMLFMNMNSTNAPAHECKCGGHCGEHNQ